MEESSEWTLTNLLDPKNMDALVTWVQQLSIACETFPLSLGVRGRREI